MAFSLGIIICTYSPFLFQIYVTRLYRVHGAGQSGIHLEPVPVTFESLDPRFIFILDAGLKIFMWYGKKAKNNFKAKARQVMYIIMILVT